MSTNPHTFVYVFPSRVEALGGNEPGSGALSLQWPPGIQPFGTALPLQQNDALQTIQLRPGALSPEECAPGDRAGPEHAAR